MKPDVLFHFSEDPSIEVFHPHIAATQQVEGAWVWADAEPSSPRYWFPRDCPRGTWWPRESTDWRDRVHVIEWSWFDRFVACELYAYRMPADSFDRNPDGGGWRSLETVTPLDVERVGPLLDKHRDAGIELWVVPDGQLLPLWDEIIARDDVKFSGIRLRNASRLL